jgi:hypothetical protein
LFIGVGYWLLDTPFCWNMTGLKYLGITGPSSGVQVTVSVSRLFYNLSSLEGVSLRSPWPSRCSALQPVGSLFHQQTAAHFDKVKLVSLFTSLSQDLLRGLYQLQEIIVTHNLIDAIPATLFSGLRSLRIINLSDNWIDHLPVGLFDGLTRLESIDFHGNIIRAISFEVFLPLAFAPNLRRVHLSLNLIGKMSKEELINFRAFRD